MYKLITVSPTPALGVSLKIRNYDMLENYTSISSFIDSLLAGKIEGADVIYISEDTFDTTDDLAEQFEKLQDALNLSSIQSEVLLHYTTEDFDSMLVFATVSSKKLQMIKGAELIVGDIANSLDEIIEKLMKDPNSAATLNSRLKVVPKTIAVVGLYPGCGSTFVTLNLAAALSAKDTDVTVVEGLENQPMIYEYLHGSSTLPDKWLSLYERLTTESIQSPDVIERGLMGIYPLPPEPAEVELTEKMILGTLLVKGPGFTLYDLSTNWGTVASEIVLDFVDEVWLVITPNPAKLANNIPVFKEKFEKYYEKLRVIGNRWDEYAQSRSQLTQVVQLLQYNPPTTKTNWQGMTLSGILPVFPADKVTRAEWEGKIYTEDNFKYASDYFVDFYNLLLPKRGMISKISDWAAGFRRK